MTDTRMSMADAVPFLAAKGKPGILKLIEDMGLGGIPRHPCSCPVAMVLTALTGIPTVRVFVQRIRWGYDGRYQWIDLPSPLLSVVREIDRTWPL